MQDEQSQSNEHEQLNEYWDSQLERKIEPDNVCNTSSVVQTNKYPVPRSIIGTVERLDFPIDSLPVIVKDAVIDVENYVQAPTALIASCVLGVMSLVCQGVVKVRRDNALVSPISLILLAVAEPNERKSFVESFFTPPIIEWEKATQKVYAKKWHQYEAELIAFEAQKAKAEKVIKTSNGNDTELKELTRKLAKVLESEPAKPLTPKLLYADATKESLTKNLDEKYPCAGAISSEGGAVLGGASFTRDSVVSAFSFYNSIWSGETVSVSRSGDGDRVLDEVALMMSLAVQPEVLDQFLSKGGDMARGIGFIARSLLCYPESKQGDRPYRNAPKTFPAVDLLNNRMVSILDKLDKHICKGRLKRDVLSLSDDAKQIWENYYNKTEKDQRKGGQNEFIRDVAGKTADNASRIAGILHLIDFDNQKEGDKTISQSHMKSGADIAEYYLHEALNYLGMSDLPTEFKQAQEVSERLVAYCFKRQSNKKRIVDGLQWNEIARREIQRIVPRKISNLKTLVPILNELLDADHIIGEAETGKSIIYRINPRLVMAS